MPKWRNLHNSTNFCSYTGTELIQLIFHAYTVGVSLLWLKCPFFSQHIPPYTPISCFTLEHTAQLRSPCHCEIFGFTLTAVKIIFSFSLFTQKLVDGNLCNGKSHLYPCPVRQLTLLGQDASWALSLIHQSSLHCQILSMHCAGNREPHKESTVQPGCIVGSKVFNSQGA